MAKPLARIIVTRGQRDDCKAVLDVYEPARNRLQKLRIPAGPKESDIAFEVRRLRQQLERAGNDVECIERSHVDH